MKQDLSNYAANVASTTLWIGSALELLTAADALESTADGWLRALFDTTACGKRKRLPDKVYGVYFLLVAYAIETLAKAIIVAHEEEAIRRETVAKEMIPNSLKTHILVALARRAGVTIDAKEERLLRSLTQHAVWAGRYPVSVRLRHPDSKEHRDDGADHDVNIVGHSDVRELKRLAIRFAKYCHECTHDTRLNRWIERSTRPLTRSS